MQVNAAARKWLADHGWVVVDVDSGPNGRLNRDTVEIKRGLDPAVELVVLLHEMAHIVLNHADQTQRRAFSEYDESRREVTAEVAAGAAARLLGAGQAAADEVAAFLTLFPGVQPERTAGFVGRQVADSVKAGMR